MAKSGISNARFSDSSHSPVPIASVEQILGLLSSEHGSPVWQPDHAPLSMLVQTILSQNTSDRNSGRAFESLRAAFPAWEDVATAGSADIAAAIRSGGLGEIKAERIKGALKEIYRERGILELDFLSELPLTEARDWLKRLPGVGTKTANCVLLFSLGMPALPVDTHVFRVARRLGLIAARASIEQAHLILESLLSPEHVYQFHVLLIKHGRMVCKAQRPRCHECVLWRVCPGYEILKK